MFKGIDVDSDIMPIDEDILNDIESILSGKWIGEMSEKFYDYKFKVVPFSSL